jgi:hypothetical protein
MRDVKELTRKNIVNKNKVSFLAVICSVPLIRNEIEDVRMKEKKKEESLILFDINIMLYFNLTFSSVCNIFISLLMLILLHNTHFYDFDRKTDSPLDSDRRRILIIEHSIPSRANKQITKIERTS